ncbi:hypothetical protein C8J57DRAFT_630938 [Mycena rebaudengoi]|nr:hypothetical protein C8J57DRAFT_630938 [Mycena rebaudengoi]
MSKSFCSCPRRTAPLPPLHTPPPLHRIASTSRSDVIESKEQDQRQGPREAAHRECRGGEETAADEAARVGAIARLPRWRLRAPSTRTRIHPETRTPCPLPPFTVNEQQKAVPPHGYDAALRQEGYESIEPPQPTSTSLASLLAPPPARSQTYVQPELASPFAPQAPLASVQLQEMFSLASQPAQPHQVYVSPVSLLPSIQPAPAPVPEQ